MNQNYLKRKTCFDPLYTNQDIIINNMPDK